MNLFRISCFGFLICSTAFASENLPAPRIVGGTLVPASTFPSVGVIFDSTGQFTCSGTLIDATHVLTAGHCATDMATGKPLPNGNGRFTLGGTTYQTSHIFVHPSFNINLLGNDGIFDAAIFELSTPVIGVTPSPINRQSVTTGTPVTLVGYGLIGKGKNATLKHVPPAGQISQGKNTIQVVTPSQLIWTYTGDTSSNAPGDSGGPAFVDIGGGVLGIAGITSEGETDGNKISFGARNFDTRIDTIAPWIDFILSGTTANQPPVIVSEISTDTNPSTAGASVQFSVAATDPDDATLLYVWDFGDGSADIGPTPNHVFAIPGTYNVTATATDGIGAAVSTLTMVVNPLGGGTLTIEKLQLSLNFARGGHDSISFQGTIKAPGTNLGLPATGVLRVGSVTVPVFLDAKGRSRSLGDTFMLQASSGKFAVQAHGGLFAELWSKDGLVDVDVSNTSVTMQVDLVLNSVLFSSSRQLNYSARQGRSGHAK